MGDERLVKRPPQSFTRHARIRGDVLMVHSSVVVLVICIFLRHFFFLCTLSSMHLISFKKKYMALFLLADF